VSTRLAHDPLEDAMARPATTATVINENEARAAAGMTLVMGGVAFSYAYFERRYLPLQVVASLFFVEFAMRLTVGIARSPLGLLARWTTRRETPYWVSAKPKRFAWTLGLAMSGAMAVITNLGIRGWLPRAVCLLCLCLMWLEAVLGVCLGCELHGVLVRHGWTRKDETFEICPHGACDPPTRQDPNQLKVQQNSKVMT
jgi:Domain of unknown function (DUF4395)